MTRVLNRLAQIATLLAGAALVGMVIVEAWQVFARYVLNDSPSWTEPLALLFMSTAMMLGAALGVHSRRHFGFFLLVERAPCVVQRSLNICSSLIAIAIGLMLALWGGKMALDAWDYPMAGAPLAQGLSYVPLCVGGTLIAIFACEHMAVRPIDRTAGE